MKNKYYTPDISEFYVGFEFEEDDNNSNQWTQDMVTLPGDLDYYDDLIKEENIRIKYLDQEDIESLGFKYIKTQPGLNEDYFEYMQEEFSKYYLEFDYDTKYLRTYFSLEEGDSTIFAGVIKNKSELKKLLKQIGYYDNTRNS